MKFDVYYPFYSKKAQKWLPGIEPHPMEWSDIKTKVLGSDDVKEKVEKHRQGIPDQKIALPSICFVGTCTSTRKRSAMIPTQLVMVDIDHCMNPEAAWADIVERMTNEWIVEHVMVAHVTPSRGLHIIFIQAGKPTLKENMDYYNELIDFPQYGDYDSVVHDFARISFAFPIEDLLFENVRLFLNADSKITEEGQLLLVNPDYEDEKKKSDSQSEVVKTGEQKVSKPTKNSEIPTFTDEERAKFDKADWRGVDLKLIIKTWVEYRGEPGEQEIHNYYNEMVKYFRNIMGNNKRLIFYLLPRFGHTEEECWSQVVSICRSNTLSQIDKPFYFFLKDKGFYVSTRQSSLDTYMLSDKVDNEFGDMPTPPPVFREFLRSAPKDFRVPAVNALLPILGTLTSYLQAEYPYDNRMHTTSFFSIIYAPPGTGKGFVERFMDILFEDLRLRDYVQSARENVYLRILNRKGDNEKSPENPNTSLRIIPPKNSESEFLSKQRDNKGYHMFTFAAEMDSWAKGEKAAGGNKSDMIRIAWDNGKYGQNFKSYSTFKGEVNLYWNVLITGTLQQVENYFKNVENGLVTRCSYTSIENQEFQLASIWKPIPKKGLEIIRNFMARCDYNTYETPCEITIPEVDAVSDDEFDKEIDWRFKFRPRQTVDLDWIMPIIDKFEKEQCQMASLDIDRARDVFRRRVGVRGFRLALMCTALYPKLTARSMETIKNFVNWWMHVDIECMLNLWGAKYNAQAEVEPQLYNRNAYKSLGDTFTRNDLFVVLKQQKIKSPIRSIIYQWKKEGYIEKIDNDTFKKCKKNG